MPTKMVNFYFGIVLNLFTFLKNLFLGVSQYTENENIGGKHEKLKTKNHKYLL